MGDGKTIKFWTNCWLDTNLRLADYMIGIGQEDRECTMSMMVTSSGDWDWQKLETCLPPSIVVKFLAVPPPTSELGPDSLMWPGESNGSFSVKSAYKLRQVCRFDDEMIWSSIWKFRVSERVKSFIWLAFHGRLNTNARRARWSHCNQGCQFCGHVRETWPIVSLTCPQN